jgi:energy-coupling factor transporter ATP-binding protein EcfA2
MKKTTDKLTEQLYCQTNGIVLLDGYSGCGKTTLLRNLKQASYRPVYLLSYRDVVDVMLCAAQRNKTCERHLLELSRGNCIIGIEDVDYLRGKETTQEWLAEMVQAAAGKHLVILTGNDVQRKTPALTALRGMDIFTCVDTESRQSRSA